MKTNFLTKFLTHQKSFKKGGVHTDPSFFWHIILSVAFVVICASFVFAFFLFRNISQDPVANDTTTSAQSKTIKKERIDTVLQFFDVRQNKMNDILNSPSPVHDPSI